MKIIDTRVYTFYAAYEVMESIKDIIENIFEDVHLVDVNEDDYLDVHAEALAKPSKSQLFIYAFEDPLQAKLTKIHVHDNVNYKKNERVPKYDVLICERAERYVAYDLCVANEFYTYETTKPVYDSKKLSLTFTRLSEQLLLTKDVKPPQKQTHKTQSNKVDSAIALQEPLAETLTKPSTVANKVLSTISHYEWKKAFQNVLREIDNKVSSSQLKSVYERLEKNKDERSVIINNLRDALKLEPLKKESYERLVIIADDQPVMQKIIKAILEAKKFTVETANNGVEAIIKAKLMSPALILLDIEMPTIDGIDTLKVLSNNSAMKNVPVIMLTSHADKDLFKSCIELGAVDYVVKPTNASILLSKVNKAITVEN